MIEEFQFIPILDGTKFYFERETSVKPVFETHETVHGDRNSEKFYKIRLLWEESDIVPGTKIIIGDRDDPTHVIAVDSLTGDPLLYDIKTNIVSGTRSRFLRRPYNGMALHEYLNHIEARKG